MTGGAVASPVFFYGGDMRHILLVTPGDPAGAGPVAAVRALKETGVPDGFAIILLGPESAWTHALEDSCLDRPRRVPGRFMAGELAPLNLLGSAGGETFTPGRPSKASSLAAWEALESASDILSNGRAAAVLTMPVAKNEMLGAGLDFKGHTEYFAERFKSGTTMMLAAGNMRYFMVTTHLAIKDVSRSINKNKVLDVLRTAHRELGDRENGGKPRLVMCALNPHASDSGAFGDEEEFVLEPAVKTACAEGMDVSGPLPADTAALAMKGGEFDAAVACYHDQALIALKTAHAGRGINVTWGLPFLRTSPLHGTAYDAAASGEIDHASTLDALDFIFNGFLKK